jgi:D-alanyl-D-alanine carboxypeptidase (penicillin-binding protein 5/6)
MRTLLATVAVLAFLSVPAFAPAHAEDAQTLAKQAILVDADTGMTLFEKNPDEKMPTSSMSKTMTVYAVFEALKGGKLKMEDTFIPSEKAWRMEGSRMFLELGKPVSIADLLRGVIVQSGNDAAVTLAEGLGGTEESFSESITAKAHEMGMTNTNFTDASGMPDPNHYSTARDLAILGRRIILDFPEYYPMFAEEEFLWNNIHQPNRNPLLYRDIGADGIKTGHTEAGGYGLIGTGVHEGRRVVMVLNGMASDKERADESVRLLDWGLKTFKNVSLFKAGELIEDVPVVMGQMASVPLVLEHDLTVTVPLSVRNDLKVEAAYDAPLIAPVTKGQKIGVLRVDVPRIGKFEYPLLAGADIAPLGKVAGVIEKIKLRLK